MQKLLSFICVIYHSFYSLKEIKEWKWTELSCIIVQFYVKLKLDYIQAHLTSNENQR